MFGLAASLKEEPTLTASGFHHVAAVADGSREVGKLLEVIEPYMTFSMGQHEDHKLALDFSLRILPGAYVSSQWLSGVAISRHKAQAVLDGNDDLCLLVPRGGHTVQMLFPDRSHGRDEITLRPGECAQLWGNEEVYHSWSLESDNQVICVPRTEISNSVCDLDHALSRGVRQSAALDLLCGFAKTLASDIGLLDGEMLFQARKTLIDLFVLALGPTREATEATKDSARAAKLARIKADIDANLAHPDLSLEWISGRHGLSARAIRDLFYGVGSSFTDHVLATRLERARTLLSDRRHRHSNITAIAFQAGFGDLSWFNQAFRRRFKMTPSDVRRSGLEEPFA